MVDNGARAYTRRQILRGGVLIGGWAAAQSQLGPSLALAQQLAAIRPSFVVTARRFDDFLHLRFEGHNLRQNRDGRLYPIRSDAPVHLVVVFPPQAVAEVSYVDGDNPRTAPLTTRLAGQSRLAFTVPPEALPLEATLDALLAWSRFDLRVAPAAVRPEGLNPGEPVPVVRAPSPTETAIEMPWRLILSPHADSAFVHEPTPVTANARTQLWHTRLAARPAQRGPLRLPPSEWERRRRTVRAIHAVPGADVADITPPSAEDREGVVIQTTNFSSARRPKPVAVEQMMLSALGGWFEGEGTWPRLTTKTNLVGYRHELAQGRDQYVKVENAGWLYPFGHLAVAVTIAERVFVGDGPGAFLRRKELLVVAQPSKRYGTEHAPGQPRDGRAWPFRQLTFVTRRTPPVTREVVVGGGDHSNEAFVPLLDSRRLLFQVRGEDWEGRTSAFEAPVIFVPNTRVFGAGVSPIESAVAQAYRELAERNRPLSGQRVAIAPPRVSGDTTVKVARLLLDGEVLTNPDRSALFAAGQPPWYPVMETAGVTVPAAQTARSDEPDAPVEIRLYQKYLDQGLDVVEGEVTQNAAAVYAELVEQVPLPFPPDAAGGVLSPNLLVSGLSRELGLAAGSLEALAEQFDPKEVFAGLAGALEAKLLGAIPLTDIIDLVPLTPPDPTASGEVNAGALQIVSRTLHPGGDTSQLPEAIETKLDWDPPLIEDKPGFFEPQLDGIPATLTVDARFVSPLGPGGPPASYEIVGDLANFAIHLLGRGVANGGLTFMVVRFNRLRFDARTGQKPSLDPDIADVRLDGPLRFVEELRHYLASLTNVPGIDVSPTQISAVYDLALPSVAIGPFGLSNVAISAGVIIPFDNTPVRARFGVSSADDPFSLTVAFFSGGGYGAIAVGADGVEKLELSLEFGAQAAIDLVVASGSVSLMAGIVFKLSEVDDPKNPGEKLDSVELAGFLRLRGELSVLGLVSISASFTLTLGYETETNSAYGKGSFIVEIDVVLFSDSVEVEVERRFGGSPLPQEQAAVQESTVQAAAAPAALAAGFVATSYSGPAAAPAQGGGPPPPPTFAQQVSKTQWAAYARAFA